MATSKISEAFDLVFSEGEARRRRSAIVIFEGDFPKSELTDRKLRQSISRLKMLEESKKANNETYHKIVEGYLSAKSVRNLSNDQPIRHRLAGSGILPLATVEVTATTISTLAKQPDVRAILPNQNISLISPVQTSEDSAQDDEINHRMTWGLQSLKIREFWEKAGTRGKGIKVGVLDTGVHGDHPTLDGRVEDFTIIDPSGRRLQLADNMTFDYHRHGTHVCGTIAGGETSDGIAIGVAPEALLAVAQIHFGDRSFLSSIVDGIGWAVTQGADIINMSIGLRYYDEKIDELFKLLVERDIAPVVAIGNFSHGSTSCPGNASYAFGVGAVQKSSGNVEVASFSGGGSLDFPGTRLSRIIKPDIVAPGVAVYSCVPPTGERAIEDYRMMDGTSMAAPHVAGVVAVLMAACPDKSVVEIFDAVRQTASHPRGTNRPDNRHGYGVINPIDALDWLRPKSVEE